MDFRCLPFDIWPLFRLILSGEMEMTGGFVIRVGRRTPALGSGAGNSIIRLANWLIICWILPSLFERLLLFLFRAVSIFDALTLSDSDGKSNEMGRDLFWLFVLVWNLYIFFLKGRILELMSTLMWGLEAGWFLGRSFLLAWPFFIPGNGLAAPAMRAFLGNASFSSQSNLFFVSLALLELSFRFDDSIPIDGFHLTASLSLSLSLSLSFSFSLLNGSDSVCYFELGCRSQLEPDSLCVIK